MCLKFRTIPNNIFCTNRSNINYITDLCDKNHMLVYKSGLILAQYFSKT